jgi:hypothetical protein
MESNSALSPHIRNTIMVSVSGGSRILLNAEALPTDGMLIMSRGLLMP